MKSKVESSDVRDNWQNRCSKQEEGAVEIIYIGEVYTDDCTYEGK